MELLLPFFFLEFTELLVLQCFQIFLLFLNLFFLCFSLLNDLALRFRWALNRGFYLCNLFLNFFIFLLQLFHFIVLIFPCLSIFFELGCKSGHFLFPHSQIFIQCFQLNLLVIRVCHFFNCLALSAILFLKLFDGFFKALLELKLLLVLCLPANRISFGIGGSFRSKSFQLLLQFFNDIFISLDLFFAIFDFFGAHSQHVLSVEL